MAKVTIEFEFNGFHVWILPERIALIAEEELNKIKKMCDEEAMK
jgi:hypothetical protein